MKVYDYILDNLPYGQEFKFVKKINLISETNIATEVEYSSSSFYHSSHFLNNPVVPGVIITESIAQSALVSHVYYLDNINNFLNGSKLCLFSNFAIEFLQPPSFDKTYFVRSEKVYFRDNTFKARASLFDVYDNILANFTGILKIVSQ